MQAVPVDRPDGNDADADRGRARSDRLVQRLAVLDGDLFRVVERGKRSDARSPQLVVVEEDTRNHERAGERSTTCLVGSGHEARVELPIEPEETLAAGSSHAAENSR